MATDFLSSVIEAYNTGARFNPEVMRQQALGNQLAQQLQQLQIAKLIRDQQDFYNPDAANTRLLKAKLSGMEADPLSGITYTEGGLADVSPTLASDIAALESMDPNVRPESLVANPVSLRLGPGGQPTGFQFDPTLYKSRNLEKATLDADIDALVEGRKLKSYAPGTLVANAEQLAAGTGITVPERGVAPKPFSLSKGERLYDATGALIAENPSDAPRPLTVPSGGVILNNDGTVKFRNDKPDASASSEQYQADLNQGALKAIADLRERTNDSTVGRMARLQSSSLYPKAFQTDAYADYKSDLGSLKSKFFLAQVNEMKANSKTGATGLGPVSDKEGKRLEDAMASMDQDQSPPNMIKNLDIAEDAIKKYDAAKKKFGTGASQRLPTGGKKTLSSPINFPSEEAARAAGFGNGSTVIINGVYGDLH